MTLEIQAYAVLVVASFNVVLTGIILAQDSRNRTNIAFALLTFSAAMWGFGTGMFLIVSPTNLTYFEFFARANYFFGGSISTAFLYFVLVFDAEEAPLRRTTALVFFPTLVFLMVYALTDLIIMRAIVLEDGTRGFLYGTWHYLFDIHTWGYFAVALVALVQKYRRAIGRARQQILLIAVGTYATFAVASVANILLPHVLHDFRFIAVGPVAIIFWVSIVTYAVARHQLFNIRAIAAELPIILLWLILLFRTVLSQGTPPFLINFVFFIAVLILGIFFIRSVIKEVQQRELIERQEKELVLVNDQQEALLDFISHEVKSYFSKVEAAFAGIGEGDYGPPPPPLKDMAKRGLDDVRTGMAMVASILDASNLKQGTVSYVHKTFDLVAAVQKSVEELRTFAEDRGLALTFSSGSTAACEIVGDEEKIRKHVIRNLIDNAIRYTLTGTIKIDMSCPGKVARFVIEDTGVGITTEDMENLFTEGGHGKDALKVNVHSTGYGLYIAKQVVEAHGGTIHAFSDGAGRGSRFVVELPLVKST